MEATITTPSGVTELCEIRDEPDNLFDVKFTPIEAGTNIISLKQKGIHIAGTVFPSPCLFVWLSVRVHITKTTARSSRNFYACYLMAWPIVFWRRCYMLCTFGFMDDPRHICMLRATWRYVDTAAASDDVTASLCKG